MFLKVPGTLHCAWIFWEKVKKLQILGIWVKGRVTNKERSPSCLLRGAWGNSSSREDAGPVWITRQDRKDLSQPWWLDQVLSKAEHGVCADAKKTQTSTSTSVINPLHEHHCIWKTLGHGHCVGQVYGTTVKCCFCFNGRCPWHIKIRRYFPIVACKACADLFLCGVGRRENLLMSTVISVK